jgi:hypothetical protein
MSQCVKQIVCFIHSEINCCKIQQAAYTHICICLCVCKKKLGGKRNIVLHINAYFHIMSMNLGNNFWDGINQCTCENHWSASHTRHVFYQQNVQSPLILTPCTYKKPTTYDIGIHVMVWDRHKTLAATYVYVSVCVKKSWEVRETLFYTLTPTSTLFQWTVAIILLDGIWRKKI